jgi:hypothetical protein
MYLFFVFILLLLMCLAIELIPVVRYVLGYTDSLPSWWAKLFGTSK